MPNLRVDQNREISPWNQGIDYPDTGEFGSLFYEHLHDSTADRNLSEPQAAAGYT
jgi:hypothetical protein